MKRKESEIFNAYILFIYLLFTRDFVEIGKWESIYTALESIPALGGPKKFMLDGPILILTTFN